ncbi:MAG TPA: hypothetical protein VFH38_12265 [Jatrophihabitans sp.]|nr:hypothetical protein [Jatrophihabitans sp.]
MGSNPARTSILIAAALAALTLAGVPTMSAARAPAPAAASAPALGHWTNLSGTAGIESGTPAIWQDAKHRAYVLWLRTVGASSFTYDVSTVAANGTPSAAVDVFSGGHWGALSNEPTLLAQSGKPLVVFDGIKGTTGSYAKGCIYGAAGTAQPWALQSWSLSNDCVNPVGSAGEDRSGTLAAAWGAGGNVLYRIGESPTIPAPNPDSSIPLASNGVPYKTGVVADTGGSNHFYVAWAQEFSNPASHDGYYVKDVTASGATMKAPGSSTDSINRLGQFTNLAIAARIGHPGVYIAYCTGSTKCHPKLWRVGAAKAMSLPGSTNPGAVSIAAGPGGRMWAAWFDESTTKVYVTRTNAAVSKLGSVRSYATPCFDHGLLGLSSGSSGRLDIALQCRNKAKAQTQDFITQVEVGLHVTASKTKVRNTTKQTITMTVTDAGDRVGGATVRFAGHKGKTNSTGKISFTLARHTKPGTYSVVATKPQYTSGKTRVKVTR